MKIESIWVVYETQDEYGRLGKLVSVCRNKADAELESIGKGWYGSAGRIMAKNAIVNEDDIYVLETTTPMQFKDVEEIRKKQKAENLKKALGKLSEEELQLIKESFN
jgi:hypothetical protein